MPRSASACCSTVRWRRPITAWATCGRAIEQLTLAQKSGDGDFYQQSSVDARLRELRSLEEETRRETRK